MQIRAHVLILVALAMGGCAPSRAQLVENMNRASSALVACHHAAVKSIDSKYADPDVVAHDAYEACQREGEELFLAILPLRNNDPVATTKEMERIKGNLGQSARVYVRKRDIDSTGSDPVQLQIN